MASEAVTSAVAVHSATNSTETGNSNHATEISEEFKAEIDAYCDEVLKV